MPVEVEHAVGLDDARAELPVPAAVEASFPSRFDRDAAGDGARARWRTRCRRFRPAAIGFGSSSFEA